MKLILLYVFMLPVMPLLAQGGAGEYDLTKVYSQGNGIVGINASGMMENFDATGKRIPSNNQQITGSRMLNDEFSLGVIKLNGIENPVNLLVNFSLYTNQLFFKKDSLTLAFVNPVESFSILLKDKEANKVMNFKCGYPSVGHNTSKSFYQVLEDGNKFQLLKYLYKIVQDKFSYNGPVQREYAYRELFFIYDTEKKTITEIKPSVKFISKVLPALAFSAENYAARYKLKNEEDLRGWIVSLNEPVPSKK